MGRFGRRHCMRETIWRKMHVSKVDWLDSNITYVAETLFMVSDSLVVCFDTFVYVPFLCLEVIRKMRTTTRTQSGGEFSSRSPIIIRSETEILPPIAYGLLRISHSSQRPCFMFFSGVH